MLAKVRSNYCEGLDVMKVVSAACDEIMRENASGHTECVYEKLLSQYLYERCIPFLTQVDCFIQKSDTQVWHMSTSTINHVDNERCFSPLLLQYCSFHATGTSPHVWYRLVQHKKS